MPDPLEILGANFRSTRSSDLTIDAQLVTSNPSRPKKSLHVLSKWQPNVGSGTFNVMGRISGFPSDFSFLIEQVLHKPPAKSIDLHLMINGQVRRETFEPWDTLPQTEIMSADQILPHPGTFAAAFSPAGTVPQGPGLPPDVPCWLVDLQFPLGERGPNLVRMWIEQPLTKAVDRRIEQYRENVLLRVIVAENWTQVGAPWGAQKRTFIDAQSGGFTILTAEPLDPRVLLPSTFSHASFQSGLW